MLLPIAIGASSLLTMGTLYYLWTGHGQGLVLWSDRNSESGPNDRATFANAGRTVSQAIGAPAEPVINGADIVRAIRRRSGKIKTLVMVGHGTPTGFFSPGTSGLHTGATSLPTWLGVADFARLIAPQLARGFVISLAGCSAGKEDRESDAETWWDGGSRSLAGILRDELVRAGAPSGEVRAHSARGTTLFNPQGRTFFVRRSQYGAPGVHIMNLAGMARPRSLNDVIVWNNRARGDVAARWMFGQPLRG